MNSDEAFYANFRNSVLGIGGQPNDMAEGENRVKFQIRQFEMIPQVHRELFTNITRTYPAPPIYIFIGLGLIGTNIARYSSVRRIGSHKDQTERTGSLYKLIGPSRLGKGVALSIVSKIGHHIESVRIKQYDTRMRTDNPIDGMGKTITRSQYQTRCCQLRPRTFFISGGNSLQTHASASKNGGCGLLLIHEIKSGKSSYTDPEGSYAPILDFYEQTINGKTFRKAEIIYPITNCRIQMLAAGVKEDWIPFVQKSGPTSGSLARVIPIVGYDREMTRMLYNRLPAYSFSLCGLKKAFEILETYFMNCSSECDVPLLTLQYSESVLMKNFRETNKHFISGFSGENYLRNVFTTLLDTTPPNSDVLLEEGTGIGQLNVFIKQTVAHVSSFIKNPGDALFLLSMETNILRVASDFYWGDFICSHLTPDGHLTQEKEILLKASITQMIDNKVAQIPNHIIRPLCLFMHYAVFGVLHLNALAHDKQNVSPLLPAPADGSLKRKRIIQRLSNGFTRNKRRKFFISNVKESLRQIPKEEVEAQIRVLETQVIVFRPTNKSVELVRSLSAAARLYLTNKCAFSDNELTQLDLNNSMLID